jgi:hypothetical protein
VTRAAAWLTPEGWRWLFAYLVAACVALALHGCGASAHATRLGVIESTALVVGGAGDAVAIAAEADARTCASAHDLDICLAPVRERWRPVDATLDALRLGLGAWLIGEQLGQDGAMFPMMLARMVEFYGDLAALLAPLGVEIPRLGGE